MLKEFLDRFIARHHKQTLLPVNIEVRQSYSIEAEDLLIETLFRRIVGKDDAGTFLDLGAAHPVQHSNTYLFYKMGWRGICVEPNPDFFDLYDKYRPEDKVLNIGIAPSPGVLTYHRFSEPLINGFFGKDIIDNHLTRGETLLNSVQIRCEGIQEFLHAEIDGQEIDLLNIDVETFDAIILGNWDWAACRPKVIAAEIHSSTMENMLQSDVSQILRNAGYVPMSRGFMSSIFVAEEFVSKRY